MKERIYLSEVYLRTIEILKVKFLISILLLIVGFLNFFKAFQIVIPYPYIYISISYSIFLILCYFIFLKLKKESYFPFLISIFIIDGIFITLIVYVSGGIDSTTFILYFLYILLFSFLNFKKYLYHLLFVYLILYVGTISMETFGVIPHFHSPYIYSPQIVNNPEYAMLRCFLISMYMIFSTFFIEKGVGFFSKIEEKLRLLVESTIFLTKGIGDRDKILKELLKTAIKVTAADSASIIMKVNGKWRFIIWENIDDDVIKKVEKRFDLSLPENIKIIEKTKKTLYYPDTMEAPWWIKDVGSPVRSYIGVPIIVGDKVVAILNVDSWKPNKFTRSDVSIVETLARFAEVVIEKNSLFERLENLKKEAEELATKDYLTDLYNRRELERVLNYEISKSLRYGISFQLMMIDLDDFKKINDTFGHPEGDMVLKKFAKILKESVRDTDLIFRYGGDEFIIFIPTDNKLAVKKISERIREKFDREFKKYIEILSFDFSYGHLVFPDDIGEVKDEVEGIRLALKKVDEFLYYRKRR